MALPLVETLDKCAQTQTREQESCKRRASMVQLTEKAVESPCAPSPSSPGHAGLWGRGDLEHGHRPSPASHASHSPWGGQWPWLHPSAPRFNASDRSWAPKASPSIQGDREEDGLAVVGARSFPCPLPPPPPSSSGLRSQGD